MGHLLISILPEEGLTETLEELAESCAYWSTKSKITDLSHPISSIYHATSGPSYERPAFRVTEE
jgi:hypothetical protein